MKTNFLVAPAILIVASCSAAPKITAPASAPAPVVSATQALAPTPVEAPDPTIFTKAGADLKALGYLAESAHEADNPAFKRALIAFQKDQGLAENGFLTTTLVEEIHAVRTSIRIASAPKVAIYIYVGRAGRAPITLVTAPEGFRSDATPNFLNPLYSGKRSTLILSRKGEAVETVTCKVGNPVSEEGLLMPDIVSVECQGDRGTNWRDLFSPRLGVVVMRQTGERAEALVAVRPATAHWPSAARTGLDWATTAALEARQGAPTLKWSSTGIADSFEIKASKTSAMSSRLVANTTVACRRFELIESHARGDFPGFACKDKGGGWSIAGTGESILRPNVVQNASR